MAKATGSARPTPDDLAAALAGHVRSDMPALPGRTNHIHAGVLVPLSWSEHGVELILTERSAALREHPGEVCFPGGRPETGDNGLQATALREAREEIGTEAVAVLGELSSIPLYTSDYRLVPFVARVEHAEVRIASEEVARVLRLSLASLYDRELLHAIPWHQDGRVSLSPVFEVADRVVFGGTAHVLYELLLVAAPVFGRTTPPLQAGRYDWSDVLPGGV